MSATLPDRLAQRLAQLPATPAACVVALSGGLDSVTLLACASALDTGIAVRAIHVDHRLHPDSGQWAQFCAELAARHDVPLRSITVECAERPGESLEATARAARYAAFAEALGPDEVLLTAHHADDQLETLLYRVLRGTGTDGLRGIRLMARCGAGYLLRPLLDVPRSQILEYARQHGLRWLEDPANAEVRFDRNYLRHHVLPELRQRWPSAALAATRLAAAAEDAAALAEALAQADLVGIAALDCLPLAKLVALPAARLRNVLRYATRSLGLPLPDAAALERIAALVRPDSDAIYAAWPGAEAHRYAGALYLRSVRVPLPASAPLHPESPCTVGEGALTLIRAPAPALPESWVQAGLHVRFRSGGERFHAQGSARACELREWMRAQRLLPWMRDRVPLVYRGEELVAVADLGLSAAACAATHTASGWRVVWRERPRIA